MRINKALKNIDSQLSKISENKNNDKDFNIHDKTKTII